MTTSTDFSYQCRDDSLYLQGKLLQSTLPAKLAKKLLRLQPDSVDFSQLLGFDATALALLLYWQQAAKQPLQLVNAPPSLWAMARAHGVAELLKNEGHAS